MVAGLLLPEWTISSALSSVDFGVELEPVITAVSATFTLQEPLAS